MSGCNWLTSEIEAKKLGFDVEQRIYGRLLLIQKLKQFGVNVSGEVAAQYANEMLHPMAQRANLPSAQAFYTQALKPRGFQLEDFDRFVRHELGIQELIATVGLSGKLVTPQETQSLYVREHQEVSTEAVFFSASNYLDRVTVTPDLVLYGTGGLAYGRVDASANWRFDPEQGQAPASVSKTKVGWTAGAGAEWMFARNWSAKLEYLYVDLGSESAIGNLTSMNRKHW